MSVDIVAPMRLADRRKALARETILDAAAELLKREELEDFSVRLLAQVAGVSPVTIFNYFGSKSGVLRSLGERCLEEIKDRYLAISGSNDAIDRVLTLINVSMDIYLSEPTIFRCTISAFFGDESEGKPVGFATQSEGLWAIAFADASGIDAQLPQEVVALLPRQLAVVFAGVLMMHLSGDVSSGELRVATLQACLMSMLGLVDHDGRSRLLEIISAH